jgi:hypothetical protein
MGAGRAGAELPAWAIPIRKIERLREGDQGGTVMIKKFTDKWASDGEKLRPILGAFQGSYADLVKLVVEFLDVKSDGDTMDPERIHEIDDGDYQGVLVFVVTAKGYQPRAYWSVQVDYGSCSGCDSLQSAMDENDTERAQSMMQLALNIIQELKRIY